jgi:hypothetical protein
MEIKQASGKEQAALQQLLECVKVPVGNPFVLTKDELWAIFSGASQNQQQRVTAPSGAGSKQTSIEQVGVAVGLSAKDLSDPTRIQSLVAGVREHPAKAVAAVNFATGAGQSICDMIKTVDPAFTPAVAEPVAGFAIIGSGVSFWQEMLGDDTMGKVVKGGAFVANTVDFLTITGIIPDGGTPLRIACIAARGADAAYGEVRKIK